MAPVRSDTEAVAARVVDERDAQPASVVAAFKKWLAGHNALIMAVLLLVIGVKADGRRDRRLLDPEASGPPVEMS